jgi:hypothetical protein
MRKFMWRRDSYGLEPTVHKEVRDATIRLQAVHKRAERGDKIFFFVLTTVVVGGLSALMSFMLS